MTPATWRLLTGDVRDVLPTLPTGSVHCVVTSPPYWGLRDYGVAGQCGLEATPEAYVAGMVTIFREVRRVLRPDGTLWLNMGDGYAASPCGNPEDASASGLTSPGRGKDVTTRAGKRNTIVGGLKPKDLVGMPWRLAFALQADGWWLRSDIVWAKPNPMPESVTDRPTRAHEYVFLFTAAKRYAYDAAAIAEPCVYGTKHAPGPGSHTRVDRVPAARKKSAHNPKVGSNGHPPPQPSEQPAGWQTRNKRDVWTIPPEPFPGKHFATFPRALVEPCVLAGCPVGGTVLDPFAGAGTTLLVAVRHWRHALGIELNPAYVQLARDRIAKDFPLFASETAAPGVGA